MHPKYKVGERVWVRDPWKDIISFEILSISCKCSAAHIAPQEFFYYYGGGFSFLFTEDFCFPTKNDCINHYIAELEAQRDIE